MANLIKVKRTNTALAVPSLVYGELGFNSADGKLYVGNFSDVATQVGAGGSGTVTSISVVTANGVSGSVATSTTTPAITVTLGAITPSSVTVSGVITASAGSVALPSITTSSDTDTGLFFPAANSVSTTVGGVEKLRIDSNGVGIGVREGGGVAPSTYYLSTQANAGLTILHAAKAGTATADHTKRHLMAYSFNTAGAVGGNGIMRIKIPVISTGGSLQLTIKNTPLTTVAYSRAWEITLCDYYLAGYSFAKDTFSVTGSPNFSRVRLMTDGTDRYLVLGYFVAGAGTVSTASTTTVTGSGTSFLSLFRVGDSILIAGTWKYISAIASDTSLTVVGAYGVNTAVTYSRGDSFAAPQITIDADVGNTGSTLQVNTAFAIDFAESESTLSLVSASNDIWLTNTNSQHSFVGVGTQRPTSLFHVKAEKIGQGAVSNSASGSTVTGVNTLFTDQFKVGDSITIPSAGTAASPQTCTISAIASNTSLTVSAAITSANSAVSYSLAGGTLFSVAGNGKMTAAIASTFAGGRLTLETGVAVSSSDQTAKTTIYYTPYIHSLIGLYDATNLIWTAHPFTERSLALGTLVSGKNYDVFAVLTSGAVAIEALVWTSDSARATALVAVDGVLCKTGDTTRRYVGTFRTTTTTTTEDSEAKRFVYNANNKVPRSMLGTLGYVDNTTNETFTFLPAYLSTYAQLNGGTGNKCEWVNGLAETVFLAGSAFYSAGASSYMLVSVGIDTTTGSSFFIAQSDTAGGNTWQRGNSKSVSFAAGYHYSALNGAIISTLNAATIYRDDSRYGGTVDPIRTFISASITS
jgi:hypothetical protein